MESLGYEIVASEAEKDIKEIDAVKEKLHVHKQAVEEAEIASIVKATQIDERAYQELKKQSLASFEERCQILRYEIESFTGLEVDEQLVKLWQQGLQWRMNLLDHLGNDELLAKRKDIKSRQHSPYIHDHKYHLLRRRLLAEVELDDYLDPDHIYTNEDLEPLATAVRERAYQFKRLFNTTIYQPSPYLYQLKELVESNLPKLFSHTGHLYQRWLLDQLSHELPDFSKEKAEETGREGERERGRLGERETGRRTFKQISPSPRHPVTPSVSTLCISHFATGINHLQHSDLETIRQ